MSEYALVDSNLVKEVIVADSTFISLCGDEVKTQRGFPDGEWILTPYDGQTGKVGIGYTYDENGVFSPVVS